MTIKPEAQSCHSDQHLAKLPVPSGTTSGTDCGTDTPIATWCFANTSVGMSRFWTVQPPSGEERERPGLRGDLSTCAMVDGIRVINDQRETLICH